MSKLVALSENELWLLRRALLAFRTETDEPEQKEILRGLINEVLLELEERRRG